MSTRFTWFFGVPVLLSIGVLVACSGSKFSTTSDGLVVSPTQGSATIDSFSFNLSNGHVATISNPPVTAGVPSAVVIDPAGAYAYVIVTANSAIDQSATAIGSYKIESNGRLTLANSASLNPITYPIPGEVSQPTAPAVPLALTLDSSGKYLFVANGVTTDSNQNQSAGAISVFSVGAGTLTEVSGSPFLVPETQGGVNSNFVALGITPTIFPTETSVCETPTSNPPTTEYLYVADSANNKVWQFLVDSTSGALSAPDGVDAIPSVATGSVPGGVAVDACNRFVYVGNQQSNNVSGYSICNNVSASCPNANGSLVAIEGSPFSAANGAGPIVVDPFGNFVYVLDTLASEISSYKISTVTGALTPLTPATAVTGASPKSIAIRSDASWIFVANYGSATLSQYAVTPATGALTGQPAITTDNNPWGIAVK